MMEKVFIEDRDALIKLLGADWVVCQHMRNGGKQNKIIEEVKRDRTRPLKSLKKIKYCKKYEKYVSQQHCEFFNDGDSCEFYSPMRWSSIKDLLKDDDRPKWDANAIIKPFQCNLMNREILNQRTRGRRATKRVGVSL